MIIAKYLSATEFLKGKSKMCAANHCRYCELNSLHNGEYVPCSIFIDRHPDKAVEVVAKYNKRIIR